MNEEKQSYGIMPASTLGRQARIYLLVVDGYHPSGNSVSKLLYEGDRLINEGKQGDWGWGDEGEVVSTLEEAKLKAEQAFDPFLNRTHSRIEIEHYLKEIADNGEQLRKTLCYSPISGLYLLENPAYFYASKPKWFRDRYMSLGIKIDGNRVTVLQGLKPRIYYTSFTFQ